MQWFDLLRDGSSGGESIDRSFSRDPSKYLLLGYICRLPARPSSVGHIPCISFSDKATSADFKAWL